MSLIFMYDLTFKLLPLFLTTDTDLMKGSVCLHALVLAADAIKHYSIPAAIGELDIMSIRTSTIIEQLNLLYY